MAKCGSCGAEIIWLKHAKTGKPAPINAAVDPAGNIVIYPVKGTYAMISPREMPGFLAAYPGAEFHLNHFANCPQARSWARQGSTGMRGR